MLSDLIGIGIAFSGKRRGFKKHIITPEESIINSIQLLKKDLLALHLLHTWILDNSELIHAEAMELHLASVQDKVGQALIAGLLYASGDKRLIKVANRFPKVPKDAHIDIDKMHSFAARIGQEKFDESMMAFGLNITKLQREDVKKFVPIKYLRKLNPFIYCRLLFGTNWRADIAALMSLRDVSPTEIANTLGCSYETAHRNHKSLKLAGWGEESVSL